MKTKLFYITLFVITVSLTVLSSCHMGCVKGSGHTITETHKMLDFNKIDISGGFKIVLKQDSSLFVAINADDNLMQYIRISDDGEKLRIHTSRNLCSSQQLVISIGVKNLEKIKTSGAVAIYTDGKLVTKDISFDLNGTSKLNMDMDAANVTTEGSGTVEINLKGQASSNKVNLSGSGKIYALEFVVGSYDIETTGASHCEINVLHDLNVNTTGASEIQYRGNPSNVNSHKTGSSTLTKIN